MWLGKLKWRRADLLFLWVYVRFNLIPRIRGKLSAKNCSLHRFQYDIMPENCHLAGGKLNLDKPLQIQNSHSSFLSPRLHTVAPFLVGLELCVFWKNMKLNIFRNENSYMPFVQTHQLLTFCHIQLTTLYI